MRLRLTRPLAAAATAALVLSACADGDPPDETTASDDTDEAGVEQPDATDEADDEALGELLDDADDDPFADLADPNEDVTDGIYRGAGVILPVPEGWALDQMAFAQGILVATPETVGEDVDEQLFAQAVDVDTLPDELTFEQVVEQNLTQAGEEPTVNEEVELTGAVRARELRFDSLPAPVEGGPDNAVLLVVADDGDGRLAIFNYAALEDDFDDDTAALLLDEAGFDIDSDPTPPPAPAG